MWANIRSRIRLGACIPMPPNQTPPVAPALVHVSELCEAESSHTSLGDPPPLRRSNLFFRPQVRPSMETQRSWRPTRTQDGPTGNAALHHPSTRSAPAGSHIDMDQQVFHGNSEKDTGGPDEHLTKRLANNVVPDSTPRDGTDNRSTRARLTSWTASIDSAPSRLPSRSRREAATPARPVMRNRLLQSFPEPLQTYIGMKTGQGSARHHHSKMHRNTGIPHRPRNRTST